jgi:hypothetical protein
MQHVRVKLNPGPPRQKHHSNSTRRCPLPTWTELRKKPVKFCICSVALYGAESVTVRTVDRMYCYSAALSCDTADSRSDVLLQCCTVIQQCIVTVLHIYKTNICTYWFIVTCSDVTTSYSGSQYTNTQNSLQ